MFCILRLGLYWLLDVLAFAAGCFRLAFHLGLWETQRKARAVSPGPLGRGRPGDGVPGLGLQGPLGQSGREGLEEAFQGPALHSLAQPCTAPDVSPNVSKVWLRRRTPAMPLPCIGKASGH